MKGISSKPNVSRKKKKGIGIFLYGNEHGFPVFHMQTKDVYVERA